MGEVEKYNLKHWADRVVNDPEMLARDGKTFCNIAFNRICRGMDYHNLDGMVANEIYEYLKTWF